MIFPPPIPAAYVPPQIPVLYMWLDHIVEFITITMALLALTRLRPATKRKK